MAIPEWQSRVSPVFDVARHVRVFEVENGQASLTQELDCDLGSLTERAGRLVKTGATVLICGAISRPLEMAVIATGIQVIAHICGDVQDVADAFARGRLPAEPYFMPGCGRRHRRCNRRGK